MTKKKADAPRIRRQAILDYLNKYGASTTPDIAEYAGLSKNATLGYLRVMRTDKEVRMVDQTDVRHVALVRTTTVQIEEPAPSQKSKPGHSVHLGTHKDRPIPNQRGQGALRNKTTTRSSAG